MRWFCAGLAFAALVGLAVGTVSLQCLNVRTRARLRELDRALMAREIELFRQTHVRGVDCTREELARRWHALLARAVAE